MGDELEAVQDECDHGITFSEEGTAMPSHEVRRRWPRLQGECPKGCGYVGIGYASWLHYIAGDW